MPHAVLNEDWTEYDNRKIRDNRDRSKVSCEETWEVNYIAGKLKKHFPHKTENQIRVAIYTCCLEIKAPRLRTEFIDCVTKKV